MLKFLLIGNKNSGKTTYLTALSMQPQITIKNPKTLDYLKSLKSSLRDNTPIPNTTNFITLDFNYKKESIIEFQIDDYDGNIVDEFHKHSNIKLNKTISKAQAVLLFIPFENQSTYNLDDEIDLFIETLKNKFIPITIVITKFEDETISYNDWLHEKYPILIKKLNIYFKNISIVPVSVFKELNILKPIEVSIENIPKEWEYEIENISNEKDLLIYLNSILDSIQYYPKYMMIYEKIEKSVYVKIKDELKDKNLKEFLKYEKENKNLIESLSKYHQQEKKKLKNNLKLDVIKQFFIIMVAIVIFGVISFLFVNKNQYYKKEKQLYTQIKTSYQNNDIKNTLLLIKKYKKSYRLHSDIVKIEQNLINSCQKDVNLKFHSLPKIKSLTKQKQIASELENEVEVCNLSKKPFENLINKVDDLYKKYIYLKKSIQNLSINNLSDFNIDKFNNSLLEIAIYPESKEIKKFLENKFEIISKSIQNSDTNNIQNFIDIAIQLNIPNKIIDNLTKKLHYVQIQEEYSQFLDELTPMDFDEAISYIKIKWQKRFNSYTNLLKVRQLLNTKFNQKIKNNLADINDIFISNNNDLILFKKELNKISSLSHSKVKIIKYTPKLNADNKNEYKSLLNKYYKYHTSKIIPTKIKFVADNKNNKPLEFKCDGDKEIELNVSKNKLTYKYSYKDSQCFQTTMIFHNKHRYYLGSYDIKIIKFNTFYNAKYNSTFKIGRDDIINIKNNIPIKKELGNGYKLILVP